MNILTASQLRAKFLDFFAQHGHTIIRSAPLVPQNDPTVLFTTAGMHPLVPYLLGEKHPQGSRLANSQKCIRTTDIDEVGDSRHLTFFEMLGNWSFGDYFKAEAITWSFEFLTGHKWLDIDPAHLYVTVFEGDKPGDPGVKRGSEVPKDEEAITAWQRAFTSHATAPIAAEVSSDIHEFSGNKRIFLYGREKNWWQAGASGPAGPDTEMFVDTEGGLPKQMQVKHSKWQLANGSSEKCHVNCDCGRFVEIWNNVFMQYNGLGNGKYQPLEQKNVDTGMGLERVVAFLNGQETVFDTQIFRSAFEVLLSQVAVETNTQEIKSRIIVDHLRAVVFMLADGVVPANKDRGYILRRLLRRAMVHGKMLGLSGDWVSQIAGKYIEQYRQAYPELESAKDKIIAAITEEQEKFAKTLEAGLKEFRRLSAITGKDAFNLFQSFGIPWEITKELAQQEGVQINQAEFESEFTKHQELSRTASAGTFKGGLADHSEKVVRLHTATHLLQAALRKVLGPEVFQKGSNITAERTRFDFTYPKKVSVGQIAEVERIVKENISKDLAVQKNIITPEEARKLGAIGLFGEKYGETVSVYTIIDKDGNVASREFCGGPHVSRTGEIGNFKILKEEAVSAGVRRIKATVEP